MQRKRFLVSICMVIPDRMMPREPLNKYTMPLRDLKRAYARRGPKAKAGCLGEVCNAVDVRFRARPTGLSGEPKLGVIIFRRATSMPSKRCLDLELA